jgi:hypothetical protein
MNTSHSAAGDDDTNNGASSPGCMMNDEQPHGDVHRLTGDDLLEIFDDPNEQHAFVLGGDTVNAFMRLQVLDEFFCAWQGLLL